MYEMGFEINEEPVPTTAREEMEMSLPANLLPPIPLSPLDDDGLPAGLGMTPAGV